MLVTMLRQISGTRDGVDWPAPGETIDVPDEEAAGLIANGLADVAPAPEPEPARKGARQATAEPS